MSVFRSGGMRSVSKQLAHTTILPSLGNKDLKLLQDLITAEKFVVSSAQRLADDFAKASEALKQWGVGEGEDLGDVLSQSRELLIFVSVALAQFATHETAIRVHMKAVRTREENLDELKRRRKQVGAKAESAEKKLSKMSPEHKHLPMQTDLLTQLQNEMRQLDSSILVEEAKMGDYKRQTTKDWMALKFGGLSELAQKTIIVGDVGKQMIEEIPLEMTNPGYGRVQYIGHEQTQLLFDNASRAINEVVFQPTTGNLAYHYESGPPQPPPTQAAPPQQLVPPSEFPSQELSRPHQPPYGGGLPPQPEPHGMYPSLPLPDSRTTDSSFDRSFPGGRNGGGSGFGEFGQQSPFKHNQSQTLGSTAIGTGGAHPPRTSDVRTETGAGDGRAGSRYATFPNRSGWNLEDVAGSPSMPTSSAKEETPLPSIPAPDNSRFSEDAAEQQRHHKREELRRSASGLSDSGADLVLAYYHTQGESPVQKAAPPVGNNGAKDVQHSPGEENPYAEDAFKPSSPNRSNFNSPPPRKQSLGLAAIQPLRPRSIQSANELRAANAAAARDVGRELEGMDSPNENAGALPAGSRPPPRTSSKSALRSQALLDQASNPGPYPPMPQEPSQGGYRPVLAPPPTLSLNFTDDAGGFGFPEMAGSPSNSPVRTRPGQNVLAQVRTRSPPPSFEMATSTDSTPVRELSQPPAMMPETQPPQQQHQPEQTLGSNAWSGAVSRSSSNQSHSSSLSTLPPPSAPFMSAASPIHGTTTSMPGSPTDPSSPATPKMISAAAFKKFRGAPVSASGSPVGSDMLGSGSQQRKRAPPLVADNPSYSSNTSGGSNYTSAPTSPTLERTASEAQDGRGGAGNYNPSPLSIPYADHPQQHSALPGGAPYQTPPGPARVLHLSSGAAGSPYDGDAHTIGMAMGSLSGTFGDTFATGGLANNRLTIGDAGWRPGMQGRYASEASSDAAQGEPNGGGQ